MKNLWALDEQSKAIIILNNSSTGTFQVTNSCSPTRSKFIMHTFILDIFCMWEHQLSESFVNLKYRSKLLNKVNLQTTKKGETFSIAKATEN